MAPNLAGRSWRYALMTLVMLLAPVSAGAAWSRSTLELALTPVTILAVDVDRDGRLDLAVVSVGVRWGELGFEEPLTIDDSGAVVDAMTVVPALFDRRLLEIFLGRDGGFAPEPLRLELPITVRMIDRGAAAAPLVAWTDDGVAEVVVRTGSLVLEPRLAARSLLAGSVDLLPPLGLAVDLDGDGERDLLLPRSDGLALYLATAEGYASAPVSLLEVPLEERLPGDMRHYQRGSVRRLPLPVARDLDGDGRPDLLFRNHDRDWNELRVLRNLGAGRFAPAIDPLAGRARDAKPEVVFVGDLDGRPGAEIVTAEPLESKSDSMRAEMREAKRPRFRYRLHRIDASLIWHAEPERTFGLEGYLFGGGGSGLPESVRDLDGDGRSDLVAVRLDFSIFGLARVVAARAINVGLEFGVHCQSSTGDFRPTARLEGELKLELAAARLGQVNSFDGDFDGDGRHDYLRLGPGARAEIHRGRAACAYPARPDERLDLIAAPAEASLVRVIDFNGDGRSDLLVIRPRRDADEADSGSALDLYLSGAGK